MRDPACPLVSGRSLYGRDAGRCDSRLCAVDDFLLRRLFVRDTLGLYRVRNCKDWDREMTTYVICIAVSFLASVAGSICGIGGGVLIKPVLDAFGALDVASISFLSGCTVLSMSCYSVLKAGRGRTDKDGSSIKALLAAGSVLGGIAGKTLFRHISEMAANPQHTGAVQAACLFFVTLGTAVYTIQKAHIRTCRMQKPLACLFVGGGLGICSSFLGIGGGPINLAALFHFFSMDTKEAAQSSLYIIVFSQAASLFTTLATGTTPAVRPELIACMAVSGVAGGAVGRNISARIGEEALNRLLIGLMAVIMGICVFNVQRYLH